MDPSDGDAPAHLSGHFASCATPETSSELSPGNTAGLKHGTGTLRGTKTQSWTAGVHGLSHAPSPEVRGRRCCPGEKHTALSRQHGLVTSSHINHLSGTAFAHLSFPPRQVCSSLPLPSDGVMERPYPSHSDQTVIPG